MMESSRGNNPVSEDGQEEVFMQAERSVLARCSSLPTTRSALALVVVLVSLLQACALANDNTDCTIAVPRDVPIQDVIDAAPEGSVICLGRGFRLVENITITKTLTLRGEGATICLAPSASYDPTTEHLTLREGIGLPVLRVVSPERAHEIEVTIEGLTVREEMTSTAMLPSPVSDWTGLLVQDNAKVILSNCSVSDHIFGMRIEDNAEVLIQDCSISGNACGVSVCDEA